MMLKVLDVDGAVRRVSGGWEPTGQPWQYDADRYERVAAARAREQQTMLDYVTGSGCRLEFLRRELDDPAAGPCGRCDNCTGQPRAGDVSDAGAATARDRLLRPGVDVAPRRMWPTGMKDLGVAVSGKIGPALAAEPGRALGRLTDVGWGTRLRTLLADDAPDEPAGTDLIGALIKVLAAWDWADRPVAMATLPSATRPLLIESLGKALADIGRLPYLGSLAYTDRPPGPRRHNSAQRLRTVWDAFTVPEPLGQAVADAGGPVLLIDDRIESGWTMTVAAKLLREAGAPAVLPLVLAVTTG